MDSSWGGSVAAPPWSLDGELIVVASNENGITALARFSAVAPTANPFNFSNPFLQHAVRRIAMQIRYWLFGMQGGAGQSDISRHGRQAGKMPAGFLLCFEPLVPRLQEVHATFASQRDSGTTGLGRTEGVLSDPRSFLLSANRQRQL
jgi:hypothetical protein